MRVHGSGDEPGPDEPFGEWVVAGEGPDGTLADVLQTWTVVRRWRGVKAPTAVEAIEATLPQVEVGDDGYVAVLDHDDTHVARGEMVMLYHTPRELRVLAEELGTLFDTVRSLAEALPANDGPEVRARLSMLNSLRTQFAEALMEVERVLPDA